MEAPYKQSNSEKKIIIQFFIYITRFSTTNIEKNNVKFLTSIKLLKIFNNKVQIDINPLNLSSSTFQIQSINNIILPILIQEQYDKFQYINQNHIQIFNNLITIGVNMYHKWIIKLTHPHELHVFEQHRKLTLTKLWIMTEQNIEIDVTLDYITILNRVEQLVPQLNQQNGNQRNTTNMANLKVIIKQLESQVIQSNAQNNICYFTSQTVNYMKIFQILLNYNNLYYMVILMVLQFMPILISLFPYLCNFDDFLQILHKPQVRSQMKFILIIKMPQK